MKTLLTTIAGIALTILGEMLAFYVYSSINQGGLINGLFGTNAFVSILSGVIMTISYPMKYSNKIWIQFKGKSKIVKNLLGTFIFFFLSIPFVIAVVAFYHFTGKYHDEQLENFGIVKTVVIESETVRNNSIHNLYFHFNHDGRIWEGSLDAWEYHVGDTVEIIYSSQNPNETEWYKKHLNDKQQIRGNIDSRNTSK
jgi:hypothetical protein